MYLNVLDELGQIEVSFAPLIVKIKKGIENELKSKNLKKEAPVKK